MPEQVPRISRVRSIAFHAGVFATNVFCAVLFMTVMASPCLAVAFCAENPSKAVQVFLALASWLASVSIGWFLGWRCRHYWSSFIAASVGWWYKFITKQEFPA